MKLEYSGGSGGQTGAPPQVGLGSQCAQAAEMIGKIQTRRPRGAHQRLLNEVELPVAHDDVGAVVEHLITSALAEAHLPLGGIIVIGE